MVMASRDLWERFDDALQRPFPYRPFGGHRDGEAGPRPQRDIAERVTPVDEMALLVVLEAFEPGRDLFERLARIGICGHAREWAVIFDLGANSPVSAALASRFEFGDQPALAQRAGLVDEDVADTAHLSDIVPGGFFFDGEGRASVADQHDIGMAKQRFQTHVVVDTPIRQHDHFAQGVQMGQVLAVSPRCRVRFEDDRGEHRREGAGGGDRKGECDFVGRGRDAEPVIGDEVLSEPEAAAGLQVGGVKVNLGFPSAASGKSLSRVSPNKSLA